MHSNPWVEDWRRHQRRLTRLGRASLLVVFACVGLVIWDMMFLGRLHVGYVAVTIYGAYSRVSTLFAWRVWAVPRLFEGLRSADPEVRRQAAEAFSVVRGEFLRRFLIEQGEWRSEEQVETMTLDEVAVLVDAIDMNGRRRLARGWFIGWVVVTLAMAWLVGWLEVQYQTGRLHVERGWLEAFDEPG